MQSKLSLIFTITLYFLHKTAYFLNKSNDAHKNANGNTKFHITKLNLEKFSFWKQPIIAEDESKVSIILANKYKVKAENVLISCSLFTVTR